MGQHSPKSLDDQEKKKVSMKVCGIVCVVLLGRGNPLPVSCDHHCCWVVAEGLAELDVLG